VQLKKLPTLVDISNNHLSNTYIANSYEALLNGITEWFEGLWNKSKSFDLPVKFTPIFSPLKILMENLGLSLINTLTNIIRQ